MHQNDEFERQQVEKEILYDDNNDAQIVKPFNPKDVDIISQPMVISNIIDQLKYDEIVLDPDFQRLPDLWDDVKQSRLIESLIIRIPLPTFYFDYCEDDKLIVVDGLQRLYAIKRFAVLEKGDPLKLHLKGLEYLGEFEGSIFEDLPNNIQRRIKEQVITAYVIRSGTPEKVRTSIFTRINTGGLTLTPAEIKNSVYRGKAANLLKELAHSNEFKKATRNKIDSSRMLDCEFVNRFLAFYLLGVDQYEGNLEDYLNTVLKRIQVESNAVIAQCSKDFIKAMKYSYEIFGENAFRKINVNGQYGRINKPLFDSVSVNLAKLDSNEYAMLIKKRNIFLEEYRKLLEDKDFSDIITNGTAKITNVETRHHEIYRIIRGIIEND